MAKTTIAALMDRLEQLGYFKYADPDEISRLKAEAIKSNYPLVVESGRDFFADGEDLAEGGVEEFLREIESFLNRQGVQLVSVEQDFRPDGYDITVNGTRYLLYDEDELERYVFWYTVTVRCDMLVNELLQDAGSPERLYCQFERLNDANAAIFLTPQLYQALSNSELLATDYMPELLTEESLQKVEGVDLGRS